MKFQFAVEEMFEIQEKEEISTFPIFYRYLLVSSIPCFKDQDGNVWLDKLWHHDLMGHLPYYSNISVICPQIRENDHALLVKVDPPVGSNLNFIRLPFPQNALKALLASPATLVAAYKAVRSTDIVHSGVVGWPYPPGIFFNILAALLGKPLIIIIESSNWRILAGKKSGLKEKTRERMTEWLALWSIRRAALSVFTSKAYKDSLFQGKGRYLVAPASWIHETDIVSDEDFLKESKKDDALLCLLFAGRLTSEKGIDVLLAALDILESRNVSVVVDIIGSGTLEETCRERSNILRHVRLSVLDPVPYGPEFFGLVRKYHALVVPTISDEQPRIITDAFSQGVPVIASDTGGNSDLVVDSVTGVLFENGNAQSLAQAIENAAADPAGFTLMGREALLTARKFTHEAMHLTRARMIASLFDK